MKRIGLIGFGFIGSSVYRRIVAQPALGLEIAFVHNRNDARIAETEPRHRLARLEDFAGRAPDLIVEMAHPDVSRRYGERFLDRADYLPLSVTALADASLERVLAGAAARSGHRLLLPHGALVGADNLYEWRHMWDTVTITFRKHPRNIDFSESGVDPGAIDGETIIYDGPARDIARLYPRNVNTMVTCALATVGLDRCRARLIADPALEVAIAEVLAIGKDGARLYSKKEQPATGVSGTEMFESQFHSILKAAGVYQAVDFV